MASQISIQQVTDIGKPTTFCSLPSDIRTRIYSYCGLIRTCPIDLNVESLRQSWVADHLAKRRLHHPYHPREHHCQYPEMRKRYGTGILDDKLPPGLDCFCPPLPHQLLRVSRAMCLEVENVLYGMNQFRVSRHLPGASLNVLKSLNSRVLSLLSSLHISLSEAPNLIRFHHTRQECEIFDTTSPSDNQTLRDWEASCKDVLSNINPGQLKLSLSCNVKDAATARAIVAPLNSLPPLSEISICLAVDPREKEIQEIAMEAVSRCMQNTTQKASRIAEPLPSSLSWTSLPKELRLEILSHTDLVDCLPEATPGDRRHKTDDTHGFEICEGRLGRRVRQCCTKCTPTLSTCSCLPICAAYSTSCTCVYLPTALFSVSRDMRADAFQIFWSYNRFIFYGEDSEKIAKNVSFIQSRLARNITAISCIHTVDLEVDEDQLHAMEDPNSSVAREWANLIACVSSCLPMPQIWLSIDAGWFRQHLQMFHGVRGTFTWLHSAYATLFAPLYKHLRGERRPRKFHVLLCMWTEQESMVEKAIMGEDYDSVAEGKIPWRVRDEVYPHSKEMSGSTRLGWKTPPLRPARGP
ncbi:hypothetical protein ACLMJK_000596 [Lecanora helva]